MEEKREEKLYRRKDARLYYHASHGLTAKGS